MSVAPAPPPGCIDEPAMLIRCICCGPRPMAEFSYGGAAIERPAPAQISELFAPPDAQWDAYVYLRDNPAGPHEELWFHAAGCRRWFRLWRDTTTNLILESGA